MTDRNAILIIGPTASGKSKTALKIADKINSVIVNTDSLQVYKDLNILTSRPTSSDEKLAQHKLYGHTAGNIQYNVADWLREVSVEIESAFINNLRPILIGGTGLYFKALEEGLADIPEIQENIIKNTNELIDKYGLDYLFRELIEKAPNCKINSNDTSRITRAYNVLIQTGKPIEEWWSDTKPSIQKVSYQKLLINPDREKLYKNAENRFGHMLKDGAIEEVEQLNSCNYGKDNTIMKAIGVREISDYIAGKVTLDEAVMLAKQKTRNYIKRQQTWINSNNITWNSSYKKLMESL